MARQIMSDLDPVERLKRQLEGTIAAKQSKDMSIADALDQWLESKGKKLTVTQEKYKTAVKKINRFASQQQIVRVEEFTAEMIQQWVNTWGPDSVYWKMGVRTQGTFLERVKNFFRFCRRMGWIQANPAEFIDAITESSTTNHTEPLSRGQFAALLKATEQYDTSMRPDDRFGAHLRALVEMQRWCGLRIGDALTVRRDAIRGGNVKVEQHGDLKIKTKKTGMDVFVMVPLHVQKLLNALPDIGPYYFWSGKGTYKSLVTTWERKLVRLRKYVDWHFHSHQLRDTFAVEHLQAGVSLEDVSMMLGHANTRITEKFYSPWTIGRQDRLAGIMRESYAKQTG